ncbi:hypothetical protein [Paenibacillus sp. y28]|uniref:hypothetical protein n=1 Tax=Paenibacillus sp. y28 TaxID=3129110 RepID=UPI003018ADC6
MKTKASLPLIPIGILCCALVMTAGAIGVYWSPDEGWNLLMAEHYAATGEFINIVYDAPLDFGRFWFYLLSQLTLIAPYEQYFVYRLPSLLLSICSLVVLARMMSVLRFKPVSAVCGLALFSFWTVYGATGISLRPESIYIFSTLLSLYAGMTLGERGIGPRFVLVLLFNFIAFAMHPNGIFGFAVLGLALLYFRKRLSLKPVLLLVPVSAAGLALLYALLTWDSTWAAFMEGYLYNAGTDYHQVPFYKEYQRYIGLASNYLLILPFFLIAFVALLLKTEATSMRFVKLTFWLSIAYLFFLPVKWHYYFSVAVPPVCILFAYFHEHSPVITIRSRRISFISIILAFLVSSVAVYEYDQAKENAMLRAMLGRNVFWMDAMNQQAQQVVAGKKIAAPTVFFPYLTSGTFVPYNEFGEVKFTYRSQPVQPDYLITTLRENRGQLMDKWGMTLEYEQSLLFQGVPYTLYSVKQTGQQTAMGRGNETKQPNEARKVR